jgi:hypothetical protein
MSRRRGELGAAARDVGRERGVFGKLGRWHDRIEALGAEILHEHLVAERAERLGGGGGERVVEAGGIRVGDDEEDLHAVP